MVGRERRDVRRTLCSRGGTARTRRRGCTAKSAFDGIASIQALDELTVQIVFDAPTPYPYRAFVGSGTPIISSKQFADCVGVSATTSACQEQYNAPLGTGPYRLTNFKPTGISYERNPHYHGSAAYFDQVVVKGGGDAAAAARTVMEKGEVDYAWNVQVEPETLAKMEEAGLGTVAVSFSSLVERIRDQSDERGP